MTEHDRGESRSGNRSRSGPNPWTGPAAPTPLARGGSDDRAVSPVIGVVLMVAITAILAAVTGTFVLGLEDARSETAPQARFSFEKLERTGQPDELRITHESGDEIPNGELFVTADVEVQHESGSPGPKARLTWDALGDDGETVTAGDSVMVEPPDGDPELEDKEFRVVWEGDGDSATLAVWDGAGT